MTERKKIPMEEHSIVISNPATRLRYFDPYHKICVLLDVWGCEREFQEMVSEDYTQRLYNASAITVGGLVLLGKREQLRIPRSQDQNEERAR